jgi:hypothetical protein
MEEIPPFDEAVAGLRDFLRSRGCPDRIVWVFCEDFYSIGVSRHRVVRAPPLSADLIRSVGAIGSIVAFFARFRQLG